MPYTVVWTQHAEDQLADLWLSHAPLRKAITDTANALDAALRRSPHTSGILSFDTVYSWEMPPLGIDYEVMDDELLVQILAVWVLP
jgi:hypothetical protein